MLNIIIIASVQEEAGEAPAVAAATSPVQETPVAPLEVKSVRQWDYGSQEHRQRKMVTRGEWWCSSPSAEAAAASPFTRVAG